MTPRIRTTLWRGLRLRCPRCGAATLFKGWFAMHETCPRCDMRFEREPGYFIGAIYINYAITVVISLGTFFLVESVTGWTLTYLLPMTMGIAVSLPLLLFRFAKSLWLSVDYLFNPEERPPIRLVR